MVNEERLRLLGAQWAEEADQARKEADRLERVDRSRHSVSISMLEAQAQALDKCAFQIDEALGAPISVQKA